MAGLVRYVFGTEAQILALTAADELWYDRAFYYPSDQTYFYQVLNGQMKRYGDGVAAAVQTGIGCFLNDKVMGGVKTLIEGVDSLLIPDNYDYNTFRLDVEGLVQCNGQINIL
jgi:hypothetical protein